MSELTVLGELLMPVESSIAARLLALVDLVLSVPTVVLLPISTRREGLVAEFALEWPVSRVLTLMHLEI